MGLPGRRVRPILVSARWLVLVVGLAVTVPAAVPVAASPFAADLAIDVRWLLSPAAISPTPGAARSGTLGLTAGGSRAETLISDTSVTGALPLAGRLTALGDGIDLALSATGSGIGAQTALTIDGIVDLHNTAGDRLFDLVFGLGSALVADAAGADAFSTAQFELLDRQFLNLLPPRVVTADSFLRDPDSDRASDRHGLALRLLPGERFRLLLLADVWGVNDLSGVGRSGDSFSVAASIRLDLERVTASPMPLPGTLALLSVGLALVLALARRACQEPGQRSDQRPACAPGAWPQG